ncbi:MAG: hypothetical protein CL522_02995 [Actinobacteria bacterium]|nr:hypothetical protein [Actinomycetota bacterium]|tara:strand:+ start:1647 stop:2108 length:462 start_codon:yes stop_codon:yes gene_type:complete
MKLIIGFIFLLALTACSGSSPEADQQAAEKVQREDLSTDIGACDSLESFDQCPAPLPAELMDIEQELLEEVGSESVPYLQRMYLVNCVSRSDVDVDRSEVATTCRCLYRGLVNHLRSQGTETQAVRWFIELEDSISEGKVPSAWAMDVYIACA